MRQLPHKLSKLGRWIIFLKKMSPELLSQCIHNVIKVHDLELRANQTEKQYKRIVETILENIFHWILKKIYLLSIRLSVHLALSVKN